MGGLLARTRPLYRDRRFRRLLAMNLLVGLAASFAMPFMSMFGTIEVGMSFLVFGVFMTVNAASGIVVSTVLAHLSDVRFSRRSMLLLGGLAGAVGYVGYAYFRSFTPLVIAGSLALGVSSITFSQLFAYARELLRDAEIDPAESAYYINVFRMFMALAWTVGPALASWVMLRFSYRGLFLCAAANLLLFCGVVYFGLPSATPARRSTDAPPRPSTQPLLRLLARADVLAHFAAFVLIAASTSISMMNLPLFIIRTLHGTETQVGIAYSVAPVFELPFMLYFGWLATRRAPARIIRLGMALCVAYYGSLLLLTATSQVYLCQCLAAAATAVVQGVAITYFQSHLPEHPATATNLYSSAQRIGSTAGYLLFAGLAWRFGHRAVFEACALFAFAGLLLMLVPVQDPRSRAEPQPADAGALSPPA
jgi:SET family sugar efflux transporter-like MFS transporter